MFYFTLDLLKLSEIDSLGLENTSYHYFRYQLEKNKTFI